MDEFDLFYCLDPETWKEEPEAKPQRRLTYLPGLIYPIEDEAGVASMLTAAEANNLELNVKVKVEWFDLETVEGLTAYTEVYQQAVLQQVMLYSEEAGKDRPFLKLLRWAEFYYTIPQQLLAGLQAR